MLLLPMPAPGDVILYPANGASALSSRIVVALQVLAGRGRGWEQYSHGAIMAQSPGMQYEAVFPWARLSRIDTSRAYEIWNIGDPSPAQRRRIVRWCQSHLRAPYDLSGVLTGDRIRLPGSYYCTRYCGTAYLEGAGLKIGDDIFTPDSLPDTPAATLVYRYSPEVSRS